MHDDDAVALEAARPPKERGMGLAPNSSPPVPMMPMTSNSHQGRHPHTAGIYVYVYSGDIYIYIYDIEGASGQVQ